MEAAKKAGVVQYTDEAELIRYLSRIHQAIEGPAMSIVQPAGLAQNPVNFVAINIAAVRAALPSIEADQRPAFAQFLTYS